MSNYNSNSAVVKQTQTAINAAGYSPPLAEDGEYGPMTAAGVKWFQAQHGLTVDGIIGDQTVAATIGPAPGGASAGPVADLQTQIAALKSGLTLPPAATALLSAPVTTLAPPSAVAKGVKTVIAAVTGKTSTGASADPLGLDAVVRPPLFGAVGGAVLGSIVRFGLGTLAGGFAGLMGGAAYVWWAKHHAAPKFGMGASGLHGEFGYEPWDFEDVREFDSTYGDPSDEIMAGEIGMPSPYGTLKG